MSCTGMPSVTQTTKGSAEASSTASPANLAGTKTREVLAPVASAASATVSKTGVPSTESPPLPGVTPATTLVPYARLRSVWNAPSLPVIPWTTSRVFSSTRMATD